MAKVVDLSVLMKDPTIIKINEKEQFELPGGISTQFTIELMDFYAKIQKAELDVNKAKNTDEIVEKCRELIKMLKKLVLKILQQDKKKKVDMKYIDDNLDNIDVLRAIVEIAVGHIKGIETDPNYNSPKLQKEEE